MAISCESFNYFRYKCDIGSNRLVHVTDVRIFNDALAHVRYSYMKLPVKDNTGSEYTRCC